MNIEWKYKDILRTSFYTVFKKGVLPWLVLVGAAMLFSLFGAVGRIDTLVLDRIDSIFGLDSFMTPDNLSVLEDYASDSSFGKKVNTEEYSVTNELVMALARKNTLIVQLLAMNKEYMKRNSGEVLGLLIVAMLLMVFANYFFANVMEIGKARFVLENRFQREGRYRRIFAPFGSKKFLHLILVYLRYFIVMSLWMLTIVGYIYKSFQYSMVPYLLAEDPELSWKEVKKLSKEMTKGYKWKMFVTYLCCIPLFIIDTFPVLSFLISKPILMQLDAEMYIRLRERTDIDRKAFIEPAFDGRAYVYEYREAKAAGKNLSDELPAYKMQDIMLGITDFDKADKYKLTDFIVMFFMFDLVGYIWEVSIHIVEDHKFVNRGMMYGPWIPIYGFGGVFIIFFLNRFKNNKPKLIILTMLLCGVLEYLTSLVLDIAMNASYWDYNDMSFNINGRVCLAGLCAFAIGGFAGIYLIGPAIRGALEKFGTKRTRILCSVLVAAFVTDLVCCKIFGPNSGKGIGGSAVETAKQCLMFIR